VNFMGGFLSAIPLSLPPWLLIIAAVLFLLSDVSGT
jgi:hypothetical protein